jgi:DNA-binding response OmpR family regulator
VNQRERQREPPDSGVIAKAKLGARSQEESTSHRTLVVESDRTVADSVASALRIAGHVVDTASTRADALALMTRHRYGLVVSNLRMPDLNGPSLYEELARHSFRTLPRLIFITQSPFSPEYSTFLMEVGAPLLVKPVSPAKLWESVERLLARRSV